MVFFFYKNKFFCFGGGGGLTIVFGKVSGRVSLYSRSLHCQYIHRAKGSYSGYCAACGLFEVGLDQKDLLGYVEL